MPLWGVLYAGAFGAAADDGQPPPPDVAGAAVFRSVGCSGCHGPNGQGSVGVPALTSTHLRFPAFADHVQWVRTGSPSGSMPAFGEALSDTQLRDVVCYERVRLSHAPMPAECEVAGAPGPQRTVGLRTNRPAIRPPSS
jgi:mono/diheme cytochrome c family protein